MAQLIRNIMKLLNRNFENQWEVTGVFIIIVLFLLVFSDLQNKRVHKNFIDSDFSGIILKIRNSEKGFPIIYLNKEEYYLKFYHSDLHSYIQMGDSVVKKKGLGDLFVYKYVNGKFEMKIFKSW